MKTWIYLAALLATVVLAGPARADDGCNCGGGYGYESRSFLRRCCDRVKAKYHDDPSRTCVQGKTHLDMGCTSCHAYTVFVFGSCCEFFEHPETFQYPVEKCCNRWRP